MRDAVVAYIGLGANLGDPEAMLGWAVARIEDLPLTTQTACSGVYRSAPVDASGPDFFNAVLAVSTRLPAPDLLDALTAIERTAGRERPYRNAPRTLDLDLLHFGTSQVSSPRLVLPHPRWRERSFVLRPLREVAPHCVSEADLKAVEGQRIERVGPLVLPAACKPTPV